MGESWVDKALDEVDAMTPSVGFNVVVVDTWKMAGDDALQLAGHFDREEDAERARAELEARGQKAHIYGPRYTPRNFADEVRFHSKKCDAHLARAALALTLGRAAAQFGVPAKHGALLARAVGTTDDPEHRLVEALTRSLFLDLKVNFELFLWTCCRSWLRRDLKAAIDRVEQAGVGALNALVSQARKADPSRDDWEVHIPTHGLRTLVILLNTASGGAAIDAAPGWSQVSVAFAVRHLVEHRNGRVDRRFASTVERDWVGSSWGIRSPSLPEKIEVTPDDFDATYAAMTDSLTFTVDKLVEAWLRFKP